MNIVLLIVGIRLFNNMYKFILIWNNRENGSKYNSKFMSIIIIKLYYQQLVIRLYDYGSVKNKAIMIIKINYLYYNSILPYGKMIFLIIIYLT